MWISSKGSGRDFRLAGAETDERVCTCFLNSGTEILIWSVRKQSENIIPKRRSQQEKAMDTVATCLRTGRTMQRCCEAIWKRKNEQEPHSSVEELRRFLRQWELLCNERDSIMTLWWYVRNRKLVEVVPKRCQKIMQKHGFKQRISACSYQKILPESSGEYF